MHDRRPLLLSALWLLMALAAWAPRGARAEAPPKSKEEAEQSARAHYARGEAAFKAAQYHEALAEFEAGYAEVARPGFLLNMGHTQRKLGDLRKARGLYKKYLLVEPETKFRDSVLAIIAELDSALADEDRALQAQPQAVAPAPAAAPAPPPLPLPAPPPQQADGPMTLTARPLPAGGDEQARGKPFYARAWFWVTVGAVVAAGAGAGYYLWRQRGDDFHSAGSLGTLGP